MNLVKAILRNFLTNEILSNVDLLSIERVRAEKIRFRWFLWWIWHSAC